MSKTGAARCRAGDAHWSVARSSIRIDRDARGGDVALHMSKQGNAVRCILIDRESAGVGVVVVRQVDAFAEIGRSNENLAGGIPCEGIVVQRIVVRTRSLPYAHAEVSGRGISARIHQLGAVCMPGD